AATGHRRAHLAPDQGLAQARAIVDPRTAGDRLTLQLPGSRAAGAEVTCPRPCRSVSFSGPPTGARHERTCRPAEARHRRAGPRLLVRAVPAALPGIAGGPGCVLVTRGAAPLVAP